MPTTLKAYTHFKNKSPKILYLLTFIVLLRNFWKRIKGAYPTPVLSVGASAPKSKSQGEGSLEKLTLWPHTAYKRRKELKATGNLLRQ